MCAVTFRYTYNNLTKLNMYGEYCNVPDYEHPNVFVNTVTPCNCESMQRLDGTWEDKDPLIELMGEQMIWAHEGPDWDDMDIPY